MPFRLVRLLAAAFGHIIASTVPIAYAADMIPIAFTGYNRDLVIENTASGPPYTNALELNPGENTAFYQSGLAGKSYGLPTNGTFTSALGDSTTFQLAPYTGSNALVMSSGTGISSGTLTLTQLAAFKRLSVLANSASGGGTADLTLNFSDGSSVTTSYYAPDWFGNTNFALSGFERINLTSGVTQGATANPRFYQTTIDLGALAATNRALVSLTFQKVASAGSTAVYALSGEQMADISLQPVFITQPQSASVNELAPVSFSVYATGLPVPTLQWYRNGQPIPGATQSTYSIASCAMTDNLAQLRAVASSLIQGQTVNVTSAVAVLTVTADNTAPVLTGGRSLGLSEVQVLLSERVTAATATNRANYALSGPGGLISISSATLSANQSDVVLAVPTLVEGTTYTLIVNGLRDLSAAANQLAANSTTSFVAVSWRPEDIGGSTPLGGPAWMDGGVNVTGGGEKVGGAADQFQFSQKSRTGDFDVSVRVDSLGLTDSWAQAGLMARESLTPSSPFAAVFGTPSISGCFFESRGAAFSDSTRSGSFRPNYPAMWLRLARAGNVFTGYASIDGKLWSRLGQATLSLPATLYFGYAVSSRDAKAVTTAKFRDMTNVVAATTGEVMTEHEPLGQCSRRTPLVISEIMYHPPDRFIGTNEAQLEFVEIFNSRGEPEDLSGFKISGDVDYVFPPGTVLPGGGFLVVARSPSDLATVTGFAGALGPWNGASTNGLPNDNGTVRLRHRTGAVLLQVEYETDGAWPVSADGAGHSLVLARPSYGEGNPKAWSPSDQVLGSPGRLDPLSNDPLAAVRINEFLAHTDDPDVDYIELYNHSNEAVNIGGCVLSDKSLLNGYVIPSGTTLQPGGFVYFTQTTLGFSLKAEGETIYLSNPAGTRVIDAVRFDGQQNGVATGRWPDGGNEFYRMAAKTAGAKNSAIRASPVNINELMYNPASGNDDDEYVELYNPGPVGVDLTGWRIEDGIGFTFPSNTVIAANSYLVVARNAARLRTNYAALNLANCIGNFSGNLSGKGERVALSMPDEVASFTGSRWVTNTIHIVVDEVAYETSGAWGQWADGGGSSLELKDPRANRRLAANWADSDESTKAPWGIIERTGVIDHGNVAANQLQVLLLGAGECLIDDVEVIGNGGTNRIPNGTFDAGGVAHWTAQGTESASGLELSEGFNSLRSYHVRAVGRGDNQVNRIRTGLIAALNPGEVATIRAKVRWLKGHSELCLRLRGNWLEAVGAMPLPTNPGTPGERNSRAVVNAGPSIYEVAHSPILPAAGEPVVVTARMHDADEIAAISLGYRIDPSTSVTFLTMRDDGTGGDAMAGDGVYSATVPGQASGALVAFYLQASDLAGVPATTRYPADAPARECLVRWGENQPSGNIPMYRLWMTQATANAWTSRLKLDNTPNSVTFVLGGQRVIHTTQAQFAGSPYIAPGFDGPAGRRCGYSISFPADDPFLGGEDLVLDWPGGHGGEYTAVQEQMAYFIADRMNLPFSYRHYIRLQVNGVTDMQRGGVFEAVQQPAGDYLEQWNPDDSDGEFYKIDRAFEFSDSNTLSADPEPRLESYITTNPADGSTIKKTEKYRWTWLKRSYDSALDYTNLFLLADVLNSSAPEPYTSQTEALLNIDQVMGTFAFEHIINNFDSWGHDIGKNMYFYKPQNGGWQLYPFDLDWLMLVSAARSSAYASGNGPLFLSDDPTVTRLYNHPPFLRAYLRAVQAAVDGPLLSSISSPVMDAKYASLVANGVTMCDGQALVNPAAVKTWFQQRRSVLLNQLAGYSAPFAVSGPTTLNVSSNLVTLSGTAPIGAKTIVVNGVAWPVTWTSVTNWTLRLPVAAGSAQYAVEGRDSSGAILPGASQVVTISYPGTVPSSAGTVVISEIMANPAVPDGEYVELFNTSAQTTFDLSGCVLNGVDYIFPPGSFIAPRTPLLLVKDRLAFSLAHGFTMVPFAQFEGNLQSQGETLTLYRPGSNGGSDLVIAKVRYEGVAPWPDAVANGSSLQLIDAAQDIWRPGNWLAGPANQYAPAQWKFFTTNLIATSSTLYLYLATVGDVYIDDIKLVRGAGANTLANPGFESPLGTTWNLTANFAASLLNTEVRHSGNSSLHIIAAAAGAGAGNAIYQQISPALTLNQTYTLSFWYLQSTNGGPLIARLSGSSTPGTVNLAPSLLGSVARATPGVSNSISGSLSQFPSLWINELQPQNQTGITNRAGQRVPWIELHNPGTNTLSLRGLFLANSYSNLTQWEFPADATIGPRQFKVIFADGQTALSTPAELHTSFVLSPVNGTVALTRIETNAQLQVLDYAPYANVPENRSWGSTPDAQSFTRQQMYYVTPGASNNAASAPLVAYINEWMADNLSSVADPVDTQFEDWFEIYNPGPGAIDLGGYYLTDDLALKFQFQVPTTGRYQIPPGGYLLVWADDEAGQNSTNQPALHVPFKLGKEGEVIGLFAADGTPIDVVTFSAQTTDVSQGRSPDGSSSVQTLSTATPGTANLVINTPPALGPLPDRFSYVGQNIHFFASAEDAEAPPQTLAFSIDPGSTAGATINAATGLFSWVPAAGQVGTNTFVVRVSDSGIPALSVTRTFAIIVRAAPDFAYEPGPGGTVSLSWTGLPGNNYRVQFKDDLASPTAWFNLGPDQTGTGGSLSVTINMAEAPKRFYRLLVLQ